MKNLKLSVKIGLGFGAILLILGAIGGLALIKMNEVSKKAEILANEYVAEVEVSNNIERYFLLTRLAMRKFALNGDRQSFENYSNNIEQVQKDIGEAEKLVKNTSHLFKLEEVVDLINEKIIKYADLADETVKKQSEIIEIRTELDRAASQFMENCFSFLEGQKENLKSTWPKGREKSTLCINW